MNRRPNLTAFFSVFLLLPLFFSAPSAAAGPSATAEKIDVVESETGFYYTIQKGDTLWDLSQHFNDSPWLWPELWEGNDQISNPHWIFPGERIRLYKKSGSQAITTAKSGRVSQSTRNLAPAPVKPSAKIMSNAPFFQYSAIDRVGFIRKPPVKPTGTIFAVQGKKSLISEGDIVYIRPSKAITPGDLIPGSRHTVFRYMKPTEEKDSLETIGTQHYILGIVEVTKKEQDLVIARVHKSFRTIKADDLLMPFRPRHSKIALKPSPAGIDGQIIRSEEHSTLTGEFVLAFIDKGLADNIEVGQQYSIYNRQKTGMDKNDANSIQLPPVDFGTFLVLHTEKTTSTVVITNAANNVSAGERFRTPVQ